MQEQQTRRARVRCRERAGLCGRACRLASAASLRAPRSALAPCNQAASVAGRPAGSPHPPTAVTKIRCRQLGSCVRIHLLAQSLSLHLPPLPPSVLALSLPTLSCGLSPSPGSHCVPHTLSLHLPTISPGLLSCTSGHPPLG